MERRRKTSKPRMARQTSGPHAGVGDSAALIKFRNLKVDAVDASVSVVSPSGKVTGTFEMKLMHTPGK